MAYKRILFGTDGTARAEAAAEVATTLAVAGHAELIVAHVWERPDGAQPVLDAALEQAETAGVRKRSGELRGGRPAEVLIELAEARDVGLVVVSGGRSETELGDTAERLSHRSSRDLLIAMNAPRGEDGRLYRRVLIATDGSPTADRAARKGYDLAESIGAPVTLAFVGHPATGKLITEDTVATYGTEIETDIVITQGEPAAKVLEVTRDVDADLIIVGNKGMKGAKRFFLNPVPEKIAARTERDILIARTVAQVVSELAPGEGGIIEQAGEKLAAYMDAEGELHLLSARCTHMGCTVAWNTGESTFDCPCHGSRFGPDGRVVDGPAARPLPEA